MERACRVIFFAAFISVIATAIHAEAIQLDQDLGSVPEWAVVTLYTKPNYAGESVSLACVLDPHNFHSVIKFKVSSIRVRSGFTAWLTSPSALSNELSGGQVMHVLHGGVADVDAAWAGGVIGISALCATVVVDPRQCPAAASWPNAPCVTMLVNMGGSQWQRAQPAEAGWDELARAGVAGSASRQPAKKTPNDDLVAKFGRPSQDPLGLPVLNGGVAVARMSGRSAAAGHAASGVGRSAATGVGQAATGAGLAATSVGQAARSATHSAATGVDQAATGAGLAATGVGHPAAPGPSREAIGNGQGIGGVAVYDDIGRYSRSSGVGNRIRGSTPPPNGMPLAMNSMPSPSRMSLPKSVPSRITSTPSRITSMPSANDHAMSLISMASATKSASVANSTPSPTTMPSAKSTPSRMTSMPSAKGSPILVEPPRPRDDPLGRMLRSPSSAGGAFLPVRDVAQVIPRGCLNACPAELTFRSELPSAGASIATGAPSSGMRRLLRHRKDALPLAEENEVKARLGVVVVFCKDSGHKRILDELSCDTVDVIIYSKCGNEPSISDMLRPCTIVNTGEHSPAGVNALSILQHLYLYYDCLHEVTLFLKDTLPTDIRKGVSDIVAAIGHNRVGYYAFTEAIRDMLVQDMEEFYATRVNDAEFVPTVLRALQCSNSSIHGVSSLPAVSRNLALDLSSRGGASPAEGPQDKPGRRPPFSWQKSAAVQDCVKLAKGRVEMRPRDVLHCGDPLATAWATDYWRTAVHSVFAVARNRVWMWPRCKYAGFATYIKDSFDRSVAPLEQKSQASWWLFERIWGEMFHCRPARHHNRNFVCLGDELVASQETLDDLPHFMKP